MIRLLYLSDATEILTQDGINAILTKAVKNNSLLNITGLLVFGGGVFAQVLEGPEREVLQKYVRIMADDRHRNCRIIYISTATERIFKDISMAALEALPVELVHIAELHSHRKDTVSADQFTGLMNSFFSRLTAVP